MASAQEWVPRPQVARWMKIGSECKQTNMMARFQHRPMRNSVRLLVLFLAAQYILDSSDDLLDFLAAPLFFRHTNRHRINGRNREIGSKKSSFWAIVERLSCTTMQCLCIGSGWSANWLAQGQINFSSFRKWSSSDGATARVFWNDLGSSLKTPRNLGVSTRSFDGQLLENSSSRMRSQGPNDRVHARRINFSCLRVDTTIMVPLFNLFESDCIMISWAKIAK